MQRGIAKALEKPHRSLVIQAYVEPGAPEERERAEKRALARAELVRGKLLTHGLPAKRLVTRLGDEETRRALNYDGTLALVLVTFAPADRVREDFEPSSSEYQQWCGTVPRK